MITEAIAKIVKGENLDKEMAAAVMDEIMSGEATQAQIGSFLTALHIKGETIEEITAFAEIMRKHCGEFTPDVDEEIDIVGTGGDCAGTFNISTVSSLVTAAGGGKVAKHGNRAASSKCGTADCLEALGVNIAADCKVSEACLKDLGTCFLFAQKYHPAMRFVGAVRKEMGIRTMFNVLGPLSNPARANMQLMGVYDEKLVEPLAHVLKNLGLKKLMVVYGMDCLDEISLSAPTKVCEYRDGEFKSYEITPEQFGFTRCKKEDLVGGEPAANAQIAREILDGVEGPKMDAVLLNAGAAIYIATDGITIEQGIEKAKEMITSGKAKAKLEQFIEDSNK